MNREKFKITVSNLKVDTKEEFKREIPKMKFSLQEKTLFEIKNLIQDGYTFSPNLFDDTLGRKEHNIKNHSYIALDLDDNINYEYDELIQAMLRVKKEFEPTFIYTTQSHKIKGNRYRFIYMLSTQINSDTYIILYNIISSFIEKHLNIKLDDCLKNKNQCIAGTTPNGKLFTRYKVFDCVNSAPLINVIGGRDININININCPENTVNNYSTTTPQPIEYVFNKNNVKTGHFTKEEKIYYSNRKWVDILEELRVKYNIIDNNLDKFNTSIINRYDIIEIDDYHTYRKFILKDGQRRKARAFVNAMKMRMIKPTIEKEELLYNVLWWVYNNTDNSKDPITMQHILSIVDDALNKDLEAYQKQYYERNKEYLKKKYKTDYTVNTYYCKLHNLDGREERKKYTAALKEVDAVAKKAKKAASKAVKKESNKKEQKQKKMDLVRELYNPNLSSRKNAEIIGVSKGLIAIYLRELNK